MSTESRYEWYVLRTPLQRFAVGHRNRYLGFILSDLDNHNSHSMIPCPLPVAELISPINLGQDLGTYLRGLEPSEVKARIIELLSEQAPQSTLEPFLNRRIEERTISWVEQSQILNHHIKNNPKAFQGLFATSDCLYMITGIRSVPFTQFGHPIYAVRFRRIQQIHNLRGIKVDRTALYSPVMGVFGRDSETADTTYRGVAPSTLPDEELGLDFGKIPHKTENCRMDFVYIIHNQEASGLGGGTREVCRSVQWLRCFPS